MSFELQSPETDLWLPIPEDGSTIDPHTVHTHYFGFSIPEANLGGFIYIRYQPAFPLAQGGVSIFRGTDNVVYLDAEHLDWQNSMRWPQIDGNKIVVSNSLTVEFLEPGRLIRLTYDHGGVSFDLLQEAVTPLVARPHVVPGEDENSDPEANPGGSEQFLHCTGTLRLHGEEFAVDCFAPRDRSWNQVRTERQGAVQMAPVGWTPMCFGEDLAFNQTGWESPETDPPYLEIYPQFAERPSHLFGWVHADGRTTALQKVRRHVIERHPTLHTATKQVIDVLDVDGREFRFTGRAIAMAPIPAWPSLAFFDSVYRWEDGNGRVTHATYQEAWLVSRVIN